MLVALIEAGCVSAKLSEQALEQIRVALELLKRPDVQEDPEAIAKLKHTVTLSLEALRNVATALAEVNSALDAERVVQLREDGSAAVIPFRSPVRPSVPVHPFW